MPLAEPQGKAEIIEEDGIKMLGKLDEVENHRRHSRQCRNLRRYKKKNSCRSRLKIVMKMYVGSAPNQ